LLSAVRVAGEPGHFGHDKEVLWRQRCEHHGCCGAPILGVWKMCGASDESPVRLCLAGGDGTRGCRSPPWRRHLGMDTSPSRLEFGVVFRRKPRFWLDRHGGGVLGVVSLLGASC
jgi:hypothetical protein